jgi:hypothetical protein
MKKLKLILPALAFTFAITGAFATSSLRADPYTIIGGACKAVACDNPNLAAPLCSQSVFYITSNCTGDTFTITAGRLRVLPGQ